MKPTVTILVCVLAAGLASAQSPSIIQKTRDKMSTVSGKATAASNEAVGVRKPAPAAASATHAPAKPSGIAAVAPAKPSSAPAKNTAAAKPVPAVAAKPSAPPKRVPAVAVKHSAPTKPAATAPKSNPPAAPATASNGSAGSGAGDSSSVEEQPVLTSKNSANGRRDPFISPVVSHAGGSGCSTGKKCLEIGAINLRGVVHAESGFIAVVSNSLNKAYFLRENDPVFNGYVVKITGDSIVFQETVQDRLGKTFTREVVKKITTPAV
jgi:hypothetical protein